MGRFVDVEIGGFGFSFSSFSSFSSVGDFSSVEGVANVTPDLEGAVAAAGAFGIPEMVGAGNSSPSAALRDSCLAKSDACHHSKNLRAKIEVGRRILRLESKRGYTVCVNVLGLNSDCEVDGFAPGKVGAGAVAEAMA